jgi:hypothetical protein
MWSLSMCLAVAAALISPALALSSAGPPNFLRFRDCSSSSPSATHPRHGSLGRYRRRPRDLRLGRSLRGNDAGKLCGGDVRLTDAVRGACHLAIGRHFRAARRARGEGYSLARRGDRGLLAFFYGHARGVEAIAASLIPYAAATAGLPANGVGLVAKAAFGKIASANASETETQRCSR